MFADGSRHYRCFVDEENTRSVIEEDPLHKVKTHGLPFEPIDFETYRDQYEDPLEDEKLEKWLKAKNDRY